MKELKLIRSDFDQVGIDNTALSNSGLDWSNEYGCGSYCPVGCALKRIYSSDDPFDYEGDTYMAHSRRVVINDEPYPVNIPSSEVERVRLEILNGAEYGIIMVNLPEPELV